MWQVDLSGENWFGVWSSFAFRRPPVPASKVIKLRGTSGGCFESHFLKGAQNLPFLRDSNRQFLRVKGNHRELAKCPSAWPGTRVGAAVSSLYGEVEHIGNSLPEFLDFKNLSSQFQRQSTRSEVRQAGWKQACGGATRNHSRQFCGGTTCTKHRSSKHKPSRLNKCYGLSTGGRQTQRQSTPQRHTKKSPKKNMSAEFGEGNSSYVVSQDPPALAAAPSPCRGVSSPWLGMGPPAPPPALRGSGGVEHAEAARKVRKARGVQNQVAHLLYHGCCWDTFYILAYCGLVGNPHLTANI